MNKIYWLFLAVVLSACHSQTDTQAKPSDDPPKKKWELGQVVQKAIESTIQLPGQLQPFEFVQIYPKVNGFVKAVMVDRGSQVHAGQLMMQLEAPEIEQQYFAARSKYLQAYSLYLASRDNYQRLVNTSRTPGTVSANDLELAQARMLADSSSSEGEKANYKALEATKAYLTLAAPFDGVITERNVHPGALVGPNLKADDKPMLVLQEESKLRLVIDVPEVYSNQLANGTRVRFTVSTLPGQVFTGSVSRSSGALDMKYRSEAIEVDVDNRAGRLKPGMYAEVELPLHRTTQPLVVPSSAIVTSTEGKYLMVVRDGRAERVDITQGNANHDSTEVFGDLQAGMQVVLHATDELKPGVAVAP
ncbi:MAG TPA: efflux RND transporter periplasmic adaptor subunit [Chitinophagaceae bacterium]|nr:efflux RND transporter periplasmic adaptor subunit [Chitinophagaceae bacterium]